MKKFLSNPTVAMILAVLVVIGTMLISTKVDFGKGGADGYDCGTDNNLGNFKASGKAGSTVYEPVAAFNQK